MYNNSYTHGNNQENGYPPSSAHDDRYEEWLQASHHDMLSYHTNGTAQYFDNVQTIPAPQMSENFHGIYNQQEHSQMLPLTIWQQYNTVATPHGYEFQEPAYHYPPITTAPSVHMVYEPHGYTQTYEQMQAASSTSVAMLALPVVHTPSPTGHTPSPMGSPSSAVSAAPAYAFPQPPPPPPPAPNPPPHILPHPNPVLQRQRIPQTLEAGHTHSMVEFRVNGVLGIRVQDAIRDFVNIDEGEEQVLARIGARTIRLALHWPGSQPVGSYVTVKDDGEPVTRRQFANRVSVAIARMLNKVAKTQSPKSPFLLGADGITMNDLWIQYVIPASQNMWIAELEASPS
ncbi:hypothetical protein BDW22DRAFT_1353784 [Trametopsis cervina]|nr:hypothetical protein BDW22DRAFT_1353784 [Trametopsis cervina]